MESHKSYASGCCVELEDVSHLLRSKIITDYNLVFLFSYPPSILAELMVIIVTWKSTYRVWKTQVILDPACSIVSIILRDGLYHIPNLPGCVSFFAGSIYFMCAMLRAFPRGTLSD